VPQSIHEYWVVATRPIAVNDFGMPISDVDRRIQELLLHFTRLRIVVLSPDELQSGMTIPHL
jgi:hypothetical protein